MTTPALPGKLGQLKFYKHYTLIMISAFLVILITVSLFFAHRLQEQFDNEVKSIEYYVDSNGQLLDYLLRSSLDQLEIVRLDIEKKALQNPRCDSASAERAAQEILTQEPNPLGEPQQDRFYSTDNTIGQWQGQIVGAGSLANRDSDFYCDLQTALLLRDDFNTLPSAINGVSQAFFVSTQGFILAAPATEPDNLPDPAALSHRASDDEATAIERVHALLDGQVQPMIPVSTSLYARDRFIGTLTIGLSIAFIQRMNTIEQFPVGTATITTDDGTVLAHPAVYAEPTTLTETYTDGGNDAATLFVPIDLMQTLPHARARVVDDHVWVVYRLKSMPWHLLFSVPASEVHKRVLYDFGPGMLGMLTGLALLMFTSYFVSSRYFVQPAARLVEHVAHEANFEGQSITKVPDAWRPWFDAVTRAFRESLQLSTLQREMDIAARLQTSLLPRHWPEDDRYELWGQMTPAKYIGGDFYDHLALDNGDRAMVVADVSGKGISAGLFGMVSKTFLRSLGMYGLVPVSQIMSRVNNRLCEDNDSCMFVTVLYAQYDPPSGKVTLANAGHPPPLVIGANGQVRWIEPERPGTALGIIENATYTQYEFTLAPGEQLLLYTDGVSEAMDANNEEFGTQRLAELFEGQPPASAQATVKRVFDAIAIHESNTEQSDDITCMVLHRLA